MSIESNIAEKGFEVAVKQDLEAMRHKANAGPAWSPHPWDKLAEYVILLEKRVAELEGK